MRNGVYRSTLNVDGVVAYGWLDMADNNGAGTDGVFRFEVHISGSGNDLGGVVNVLMDGDGAEAKRLPAHFSLAVSGSGAPDAFNLIGAGPNGILVEIDGGWWSA